MWLRALVLALTAFALSGFCFAQASQVDRDLAAAAIAAAYPDFIASADANKIVWRDGTESELGPVRPVDQAAKIIELPSVAEQFLFDYPLASSAVRELPRNDPGRARNEAFFAKMYGDCRRGGTQTKSRAIRWLPKTAPQHVTVTTVNGIDRKLETISAEIEELPLPLRRAAARLSGAFSCRFIAGTVRQSMHGYGAAIDLNGAVGKYWRWSGLSETARKTHRVPPEIISIFERHGFIWGGNWYHVDSIHFEYRPELLEYARRHSQSGKP